MLGSAVVTLALLATLLVLPSALAQRIVTGDDDPVADGSVSGASLALEVGVEWVEDYSALAGFSNLPATEPDALGLRDRLRGCGWTSNFAWGNGSAWEEDWKGSGKPGGGKDYRWVDDVDLAYFAGHGSSSRFYFNSTVDDHELHYEDCRGDWGDKDAEWIGIAACNVLDDANRRGWARCMDRLHLILGFKTTMADVAHGDKFGYYICRGWTMRQAWYQAADDLQPSGKIARVLAEESCHFNDTMHSQCPDSVDNDYYYSTHTVGSEPARGVDLSQLNGTMPVFQTPPLSLAEAEAEWEQLGQAFGVSTGGGVKSAQQDDIWVSEDGTLQMDPSSGLYAYTDVDRLWVAPSEDMAESSWTRKLTRQDARDIADQFLTSNGLMPEDAQFYEVAADTQAVEAVDGGSIWEVSEPETIAYQVIYSRILTYTPPVAKTAKGNLDPVEFSVVGPGTKLKVYVVPEAPMGRVAAQESVMGGVGGWRQVGQAGGQARALDTIPILAYEQIVELFDQLEPIVALSYVPLGSESREILSHTVAYYEHPRGEGQDQLIPVYVLEVEYNLVTGEVVQSPVYIPANSTYMAPLAEIVPVSEIPAVLTIGQELVFEAADASANLSDLGYDASLDFPLGSGDPDSYLYTWYLGSVAEENRLGTGRVLNYTVGVGGGAHPGPGPMAQSIILEVTDSLSPRPPSISFATYQLNVSQPIYLPVVVKNYGS
jgi:hypothetical protein